MKKIKSLNALIFCLTLIYARLPVQAYTSDTLKKIVVSMLVMVKLSSGSTIMNITADPTEDVRHHSFFV